MKSSSNNQTSVQAGLVRFAGEVETTRPKHGGHAELDSSHSSDGVCAAGLSSFIRGALRRAPRIAARSAVQACIRSIGERTWRRA